MHRRPEKDWVTQTFNGEIYGLPVNGERGNVLGFGMRKDICDELNIDYENMSFWEELHDALVKVKEAHPEMYPVVSSGGAMFGSDVQYTGQNSCGDTYNLAVMADPFDENGKIESWFTTDQFKEVCTRMYQWAQEGLIMPDASTNTDNANILMGAGKAFGYFQHMKPGWEEEQTKMNGTETVSWKYGVPTYTGSTVAWFVPTASGDPERAVAFWDLLYSDPVAANLVINGVEGENYVFTGEENKVIAYPEGVDDTNASYSRLPWSWPNSQLGYLFEGDDPTIWDQNLAFAEEAKVPVAFGFTFDATAVVNEITACTNVYQKYVPALLCGTLDPETTIPILNEEMEKAGIAKIVEEKQKQLDQWKASR
ncbi:MAG: ABC transporter substrate-binding protein [Lachnospiraceae bacterium]|nr:ABC transporter substrate-binding protein [Lachnospiraceae bacterium]MCI9151353.1 ABC transporter substrate-binding protein [Lachnospiraceae bacterium]